MDNILQEAHKITSDNTRGYEPVGIAFNKIAKLASILTDKEITPQDVCFFFMAVKLQREAYKHHRDNLVDLAGYSNLLNLIEENKNANNNQ